MSWPELPGQEILIRLSDNDAGFVYLVKYGRVTVQRGFVPTRELGRLGRSKPFAWHETAEEKMPSEEEGDAR